jgi:hypothetical protein
VTVLAFLSALWEIETDEDFGLEDPTQALGRLELNALGWVTYGDVPHGEHPDDDS